MANGLKVASFQRAIGRSQPHEWRALCSLQPPSRFKVSIRRVSASTSVCTERGRERGREETGKKGEKRDRRRGKRGKNGMRDSGRGGGGGGGPYMHVQTQLCLCT
eukprot:365778-Chlamydomonas_euryale.AAC.2